MWTLHQHLGCDWKGVLCKFSIYHCCSQVFCCPHVGQGTADWSEFTLRVPGGVLKAFSLATFTVHSQRWRDSSFFSPALIALCVLCASGPLKQTLFFLLSVLLLSPSGQMMRVFLDLPLKSVSDVDPLSLRHCGQFTHLPLKCMLVYTVHQSNLCHS